MSSPQIRRPGAVARDPAQGWKSEPDREREGIRMDHTIEKVRSIRQRLRSDRGAATAEYAITILAAVGFAGLLVALLKGDEVKAILSDLVHRALSGG